MQHGDDNPKVHTAQLCPFQLFRSPLCSLPGSCSGDNSNSGIHHTALLWITGVSCGTLCLAHRVCTINICCYYYHDPQGHCQAVYRVLVSPCWQCKVIFKTKYTQNSERKMSASPAHVSLTNTCWPFFGIWFWWQPKTIFTTSFQLCGVSYEAIGA